jgi:hypothetical protein
MGFKMCFLKHSIVPRLSGSSFVNFSLATISQRVQKVSYYGNVISNHWPAEDAVTWRWKGSELGGFRPSLMETGNCGMCPGRGRVAVALAIMEEAEVLFH